MGFDRKAYMKEYNRRYYRKNKDYHRERSKKWMEENQERVKERRKEWWEKSGKKYRLDNIESIRANARRYARRNYSKEKVANRKATDINFRLSFTLRNRVRQAILRQYGDKAYRTVELLGCSISEAREHIESMFEPWMKWDNHGEWHIDHIRPLATFDLTDSEQQKKAFHYTNLQPLEAKENQRKGSRMIV